MSPSLPDHEFFKRPTRVSRLYPVLALILVLTTSGGLYRWQLLQVNSSSAVQERDKEITFLQAQVDLLKSQSEIDQATLASQSKKLQEATGKLTEVEKQLNEKQTALSTAQDQLKKQEGQLTSNATELENLRKRPPLFSFQNQSNLSAAEAKQEDIKSLVTTAYDYIVKLYGQPYLLNQVTITFVNEFSIPGSAGEIVIENSSKGMSIDIHMKDFDKSSFQDNNTLIHEIIHGFHGLAVFESSAFEEGITVAMADAVMEEMMADGKMTKFPSLYLTLTPKQYAQWNTSLAVKKDNDAFYAYSDVAKVYQILGTAWMKLYRQDKQFFSKLNEAYYQKAQQGKKGDDALILETVKGIVSSVDGQPITEYLASNKAFNPN